MGSLRGEHASAFETPPLQQPDCPDARVALSLLKRTLNTSAAAITTARTTPMTIQPRLMPPGGLEGGLEAEKRSDITGA